MLGSAARVPSGFRAQIAELLSRETASGQFIPEIDGLRFVAIWSVVLFHTYGYVIKKFGLDAGHDLLAILMSKGAFGVRLFFAISGFIISLPFAQAYRGTRPQPRLGAYYRRRLTRLEPPYIVNLLLTSALLSLFNKLPLAELLPHLFCSLTYTHNIVYAQASTINPFAWSLEVECQFYLLAPLLAKVFAVASVRWRRLLLAAGIALSTYAAEYLVPQAPRWHLSLPAHLNYFLCGFLLADLYLLELTPETRRSRAWDLVGLLSWLLLAGLLFCPKGLRLLLPMPLLLAYYAAFRGQWSGQLFGNRLIYTIGGMCYTIYLYHLYPISIGGGVFLRLPGLAQLPAWLTLSLVSLWLFPLVLLACAGLFVLTEKPFMRRDWPAHLQSRWAAFTLRRPA
jgi:peptidoglycan/LPS O-acetylase OafA/YrhL